MSSWHSSYIYFDFSETFCFYRNSAWNEWTKLKKKKKITTSLNHIHFHLQNLLTYHKISKKRRSKMYWFNLKEGLKRCFMLGKLFITQKRFWFNHSWFYSIICSAKLFFKYASCYFLLFIIETSAKNWKWRAADC